MQYDGLSQDVKGELVNEGQEDESYVVRGSYSWEGPDHMLYTVTYIADRNGYRANMTTEPADILISDVSPGLLASLLGR